MTIQLDHSARGFAIGTFVDRYGAGCSIQKSSLATEDCIWLGRDPDRMHLTREMAADLIPLLERFSLTGLLRAGRVTPDDRKSVVIAALQDGLEAISEAMDAHIYNADDGEEPEPDCRYLAARNLMSRAIDQARKFGVYTHLEMEAALCVWECINEWTVNAGDGQGDMAWQELREGVGSVDLRHASMPLGQWCLKVYDLCTANDSAFFEGVSYDWDVIPLILGHCRDAEGAPLIDPSRFPDAAATAELVKAKYLRDTWLAHVQYQGLKQWSYATLVSDHAEEVEDACRRGEDAAAFVTWFGNKHGLEPAGSGW